MCKPPVALLLLPLLGCQPRECREGGPDARAFGKTDDDGDGWATGDITWDCEPGPRDVPWGDCDDANPARSPSGLETCDDGVDSNCDGADVACAPTGGLLSSEGTAEMDGTDPTIYGFASSLAVVSDGLGEGEPAIVAGWPNDRASTDPDDPAPTGSLISMAASQQGRLTADDSPATWTSGDPNVGWVVAGATQLTGAPALLVGGSDTVWLLSGPFSGEVAVEEAPQSWNGSQDDAFGASATAVGDVTGDSTPDLAISATRTDTTLDQEAGAIYVFPGPFEGGEHGVDAASAVISGEGYQAGLGSVVGAADFDGDGVNDLVAMAAGKPDAWVWAGPVVDATLSTADTEFEVGSNTFATIDGELTSDLDVDGDGRRDLVATGGNEQGGGYARCVWAWTAPFSRVVGTDEAFGVRYFPTDESEGIGGAVAVVDGLGPNGGGALAISVPQAVLNAANEEGPGRVYLLERGLAGTAELEDEATVLQGVHDGDWFGTSLAAVPDLDGDGIGELAIGAPGAERFTDQDPTASGPGFEPFGAIYLFRGAQLISP